MGGGRSKRRELRDPRKARFPIAIQARTASYWMEGSRLPRENGNEHAVNAKIAKWFREWAGAVAVGLTFTGLMTGATWILGERISDVEARLGERISNVETRLGERISDVEIRLGERISDVETRLGERISDVETRVSVIETKLDLLLAANGLKSAGEPRPASAGSG